MTRIISAALFLAALVSAGCGYTTKSLLPEDLKTIHVNNFINKIDPSREVSNRRNSYYYFPGLETEITRNVIDEFLLDNALNIDTEKRADLLLEGELVDYRQYPLSYDGAENVEEFRVEVFVDLQLFDNRTGDLMWEEKSFMGQSEYTVAGPNSKSQAQAVRDAVDDLSRRVVERTVENW